MSATPAPFPVRVAGTAHVAPGEPVSTAALVARLSPPPDPARVQARTGIASRHFATPGPTRATELAAQTLREALDVASLPAEAMRRLIYVSSVGGDLLVPANANRVAAGLGLARTCDCLDLSNACMGFLSAFDIAARSIATGIGPVGIVVVELGHRVITPEDPRPFLVFGDAVVAAVIERARDDEGMLASWLRNDGPAGGDVYMAHPVVTGQRETVHFTASSLRMGTDAIGYLREAADAVLGETGLSLAEIEWVLPHQPNGPLLDAIIESLHVPAERVVRMVHDVGSVAAASIPVSLHRLLSSRRVRPGDRILMIGVGTGISYGAILLRTGR